MTSVVHAASARKPLIDGELPPDTVIDQGLLIDPKYSVPFIPPGTRFEGGFVCKSNPGLTRVGERVYAMYELTLNDCLLLQIVGDNVVVEGDLNLMSCPSLKFIGLGLVVKGNLNLAGCYPSIQLPAQGEIGGDLILPSGFDLKNLPPNLKRGEVVIAS